MNNVHSDASDWVVVGRFCKPHGIKGFIRVLSFTEPQDNLLTYPKWYIRDNLTWKPIERLNASIMNQYLVTQVKGHTSRESVACLTNYDIAVPNTDLPPLTTGEHYWHELIGMQVMQQDGTSLGRVSDLMMTGSNDVLIVEGQQRHLIPYLPDEVVLQVNIATQVITVDWDVDF